MIDDDHIKRFAAVYAEAVLTYLDTREAQWLTWDGQSHAFDFGSIELDSRPGPVMLFVDEDWTKLLDHVDAITDTDSPDFDADTLRAAIEAELADEGLGERLLRHYQERLERIASGEDEEDLEEPEPDRADDEEA